MAGEYKDLLERVHSPGAMRDWRHPVQDVPKKKFTEAEQATLREAAALLEREYGDDSDSVGFLRDAADE